jgi:hypothetical protein
MRLKCPRSHRRTLYIRHQPRTHQGRYSQHTCVGLKHDHRLARRLCNRSGVQVWLDDAPPRCVVQKLLEDVLRIGYRVVRRRECESAVIRRVAVGCLHKAVTRSITAMKTHCSTARAPRLFAYIGIKPVSQTISGDQLFAPLATLGPMRVFLTGIWSFWLIAVTTSPNSP